MSMQQIMRWGNDFLRIRGVIQTFGPMGKDKCKRENPSNCQLPILSLMPNHLILPEIGWVSYCMGWARYGSPNLNLRKHPFLGKRFLTYGASYCPKMLPIPLGIHVFGIPHDFGSPGIHHSHFLLWYSFFPGLGSGFSNSQWLDLSCASLCCFHISTIVEFHVSVLHNQWGDRAMNFGCWLSSFWPC